MDGVVAALLSIFFENIREKGLENKFVIDIGHNKWLSRVLSNLFTSYYV